MTEQIAKPGTSPLSLDHDGLALRLGYEELEQRNDLVNRARSLQPLLAKNAPEAEKARRLPEENVQALVDADLFQAFVPKRFGGHEAALRTWIDVSAALGESCGSTAWVASLISVGNWLAALLPDKAQQEIFGEDPKARVCGVLAPTAETRRVDGGFIVNGKWNWATGCLHATWALGGVPIVNEAGEVVDQGIVFMPMSELSIEDTWYVAGMRGTGSNTLVAEEVFVPDHRVMSVPPAIGGDYPTEHDDEALYRSAFVPFLAAVVMGPMLGMARAALQIAVEKAPKRAIAYTVFEKQTDSVAFQLQIAEAAMKVDTAHMHVYRAVADIDDLAERGEYPDLAHRARVRCDCSYVTRVVREAIDICVSAHGTSSMAEVNPMQRIWRDANTCSRHAVLNTEVGKELYGKSVLGVEENITPLI